MDDIKELKQLISEVYHDKRFDKARSDYLKNKKKAEKIEATKK